MAKHRRKKSHRLYALVVILLGLAIIVGAFLLLFYVQKIEVKGNEYTESEAVTQALQKDTFSFNSLYLLVRGRFTEYEMPGSITSAKVGLKNPWTVTVTVKEKPIIGYLYEDDNYVFFDKEGTVVLKGREMAAQVPCIEGIDTGETKLYEPLQVESEKLFQAILDVAQEVDNYELAPDRIVCADGGIDLYFGDIRVMLGSEITTEKMAQIAPVLAKLEGQKGVLHLEHFGSETDTITFSIETSEEESAGTEGGDAAESEQADTAESAGTDLSDGSWEEPVYEEW